MANTLQPYPTDLNEAVTILLAHVEGKSSGVAETAHACHQIVGVGLGTLLPDPSDAKAACPCPPCPDGPCPCPCPCKADQIEALKQALQKRGRIGDWLKTPAGQQVLQTALTVLMSLLSTL